MLKWCFSCQILKNNHKIKVSKDVVSNIELNVKMFKKLIDFNNDNRIEKNIRRIKNENL